MSSFNKSIIEQLTRLPFDLCVVGRASPTARGSTGTDTQMLSHHRPMFTGALAVAQKSFRRRSFTICGMYLFLVELVPKPRSS